ncbi:MAG: hypothetical protein JW812_01720 [Alphaproteobacteria bacterium]|nr:hypothetical protein [Alphaproteobacteria bacterium]MBN2779748.1 hypothetical protein [Alphaproteobacteria bacterium]
MKSNKGLISVLLLIIIGGGLIMASVWGEARRKELAYEVFSTIDKFKDYVKKQEAESEKLAVLEKQLLEQAQELAVLKEKVEVASKDQAINTDKFVSVDAFEKAMTRLAYLEKNNTTQKTKQILSLHTMANLRRSLEDERGYQAELITLRKMYPTWTEWDILAKYSETGVPTLSALTSSFYDLIKKQDEANVDKKTMSEPEKWWSFVVRRAKNMIRIEKTKLLTNDQTTGDILARAGQALERNNLRRAVDEISRLEMSDPKVYAHFKVWHGKAIDRLIAQKVADEMMMRLTAEIDLSSN